MKLGEIDVTHLKRASRVEEHETDGVQSICDLSLLCSLSLVERTICRGYTHSYALFDEIRGNGLELCLALLQLRSRSDLDLLPPRIRDISTKVIEQLDIVCLGFDDREGDRGASRAKGSAGGVDESEALEQTSS